MTDAVPTPAPIGGDASSNSPAAAGAQPSAPGAITEDLVKLALRRVKDPEVNLNIVDMGLIYDVRIAGSDVTVDMSLTTPACPSGPQIMSEAEEQLKTIDGIGKVELNLVWSPPWGPQRIEPRVRAYLGF
jgi:metal-sulfur cluster biosynthetic enzyme